MSLTKPQLIVFGGMILVIVLFVLVFTCAVPGLQKCRSNAPSLKATLLLWSVGDDEKSFSAAIAEFQKKYPEVQIQYKNFGSASSYESSLLDALASGSGPDMFSINNLNLKNNINKIAPVSADRFSLPQLRALFPQTVEQDFYRNGKIFALPVSIDTLALFYNRDFLDQDAIPVPQTWGEFKTAVPRLTKFDVTRKITRSGAAIGGSLRTIENARDLLSLLMLQNGTELIDRDGKSASFASSQGENALRFYSQFTDSRNEAYSWHEGMSLSQDAFAEEKVAMIFDYAVNIPKLKSKNAFLNFEIAPVPQFEGTEKPVSYPRYDGFSVSRQSRYQTLAWDFIITLTTNRGAAEGYLKSAKKPPALRSLIQMYANDSSLGVFARQALTARSPRFPYGTITEHIFSDMIQAVVEGKQSVSGALRAGEAKINEELRK